MIKHLEPRYIYKDEIELDFLTKGKTLIEVKYNETLKGKQKELFDIFEAKQKLLISDVSKLSQLPQIE